MEMPPYTFNGLGSATETLMAVWIAAGILAGMACLIIAIWIGYDAANRRQPGFLWFLLTLLVFPVGLTAWLLSRVYLSGPAPQTDA